jgi:hypothetical protein
MNDPNRRPSPDPAAGGEELGALTGATGNLTPDDPDEEFVPAERREIEDPGAARVLTSGQHRQRQIETETDEPGHLVSAGADIAPNDRDGGYGSEHGLASDDPAYHMEPGAPPASSDEPPPEARPRETRIGGDHVTDEEHL